MIFEKPPTDFHSSLAVSAVFVEVEDTVLFLLRAPHVSQGSTWAIPGGKVHDSSGETAVEAAKRELHEEVGIAAGDLIFCKTVYIKYPQLDYTYHMYRLQLTTRPVICLSERESSDYRWLTREQADGYHAQNLLILDEMPCIEAVYGDRPFGSAPFLDLAKVEQCLEQRQNALQQKDPVLA